jgi:hypothetical protein
LTRTAPRDALDALKAVGAVGRDLEFAKEWASTVKSQVKAEARTYKAARRSGDRAAAERAKRSLDELVADVKRSARAQRGRG